MQTLILRGDLWFSGFGANDGWSLLPSAAAAAERNQKSAAELTPARPRVRPP